jgi:HD-GYP domain-containing protein (c-di-GMP phosphodiesterase class II)
LIERASPRGNTYTVTYRAQRKDGSFVWLETSAKAILNGSNKLEEIQAASRNITERKRADEALKVAHKELRDAYERTIEGWVRALDLRDRETEGHTQRVTELTVRFASRLGFSDQDLVHIRRGALLHDMGKMAIRDEILQKPGPLTEEEWKEMRRHPIYAYEMLHPIAYLRAALDIPYCHHEHWDGNGYPRGLKSVDIPLAARLFTIVDVWDALNNDRPYRKKMDRHDVVTYISNEAGKIFDPELTTLFLEMIREEDKKS